MLNSFNWSNHGSHTHSTKTFSFFFFWCTKTASVGVLKCAARSARKVSYTVNVHRINYLLLKKCYSHCLAGFDEGKCTVMYQTQIVGIAYPFLSSGVVTICLKSTSTVPVLKCSKVTLLNDYFSFFFANISNLLLTSWIKSELRIFFFFGTKGIAHVFLSLSPFLPFSSKAISVHLSALILVFILQNL